MLTHKAHMVLNEVVIESCGCRLVILIHWQLGGVGISHLQVRFRVKVPWDHLQLVTADTIKGSFMLTDS